MLDVHVPHEKIHGLRDFFLHLFTITIGLLIALSLEGCVEWQHHRHLVREAEAALHDEIENNAKQVANIRQQFRTIVRSWTRTWRCLLRCVPMREFTIP